MKQLSFVKSLVQLILSGEKTITWHRHPYDFEIAPGDILDFVESVSRKPFAKAKVISVKNTTFAGMTSEDKSGHEKFASDEDAYETYSNILSKKLTRIRL